MAVYHDVALILGAGNGQTIDVWDGWEYTIDLLHPGQAWTFHFWHSQDRRSTWNQLLANVKIADSMRLTVDGAIQLTGRIVTRVLDGPDDSMQMIVSGMSVAALAAKWDVEPQITLRNVTLEDALHRILDPLFSNSGQTLTIGADVDASRQVQQSSRRRSMWGQPRHRRRQVVDNFHPRPGEKRWACADRLVRRYGYMMWEAPDPNGGLSVIVDVPITTGTPIYQFMRTVDSSGRTTNTSNIEHGTHTLSIADVPTQVQMCSAAGRGDGLPARYLALLTNSIFSDPRVAVPVIPQVVYRVTEHSRDAHGATQEGRRIIAESLERWETYEVTVQGASQTVGGLPTNYAVNSPCHIRDDFYNIDSDWIITSVTVRGSRDKGVATTMRCVPLGNIALEPDPSPS